MKRIVLILCTMFCCVAAIAQTINIDWKVGNNIYSQSTCEYGGDLTVPATPPTKYGYTFQGWGKYLPIEYIESTGTQYIDTGYVPSPSMRFFVDFLTYNEICQCAGYGAIFGGNWKTYVLTTWTSDTGGYFGVGEIHWANRITRGRRGQISFIGNVFTAFNGTTTTITSLPRFTESAENLLVFKEKTGGYFIGKLYSLKLYDDDTLVRDFIPVLDKNGTPCMYDKVEGKFYYNAGTGQFIAGPVISGE